MAEHEPQVPIPPSDEVMAYWAAHDDAESPSSLEDYAPQSMMGFIRSIAKKGLDKAAKKLMEKIVGDGPDYLKTHDPEYGATIDHIKEVVRGSDGSDFMDHADFEARLKEYTGRIRTNPNGENFEQRMPAIAYEQARGVRNPEGRLVLRISRPQAGMMRSYREMHQRERTRQEFNKIIGQIVESDGGIA